MVRNKHVYINGSLWNDPHACFSEGAGGTDKPPEEFDPVTVPHGQF